MAIKPREIPLNGRLRTADDPLTIQPNDFQEQTNLRCGDTSPRGVCGQTKINTTQTPSGYRDIKAAHHFRKDSPGESHVLVQAGTNIYRNSNEIPSQGNFTAAELFTGDSGMGSFSDAPNGMVAYANGVDTCIWGGLEMQIGSFLVWDAEGNTYKQD